jgi:tellurite resistance protein
MHVFGHNTMLGPERSIAQPNFALYPIKTCLVCSGFRIEGSPLNDTKTEFRVLLKCLIAIANSDGVLHEKEIDTILEILNNILGLNMDREQIVDACQSHTSSVPPDLQKVLLTDGHRLSDEMKELTIKGGYLIMVSDGRIVAPETGTLSEIATLLEVEEDIFSKWIREVSLLA